jgi:hypothetical protein
MNLKPNKFYKFTWKSYGRSELKTVVIKTVEVECKLLECIVLAQKNCKYYRAGYHINIYPKNIEHNWDKVEELSYEEAILEIMKED